MQYKDIAQRLAEDITKNRKPGDRLPGVRELALQENISLVTARNVYLLLKEMGLIAIRQGAGTYVRSFSSKGHVDMATIGPPDEMLLWTAKYLSLPLEGLTEYDPPLGYEPLRAKAGEWLGTLGVTSLPLVTAGSQQALFLAGMALLKPGDVVAVEDPCYQGAVRIFESLGAVIKTIPAIANEKALDELKDDRISLLYTMPQGHFPTGLSIPPELREKLLDIAREYGFYIMEDDPISELLGLPPLKSMDKADRVIYTKSLSNTLGPGLRIGFSLFPQDILETVIRLKEINDLSISSLIQRMLHTLMSSADFTAHTANLKSELCSRRSYLADTFGISSQGICLWVETPMPGRIFMDQLFHEGIKVTPGDIYGLKWANHVRISLLRPSGADFPSAAGKVLSRLKGVGSPMLINLL